MLRLPELVGSPLSINGLREDLRLNHATVAKWLDILENTYAIFRLNPFGGARIRAVKKERKHYHFDWTLLKEKGKRFENLVACHLLKWVNFVEDTQGESIELRYFRDVERREIDFVVERDGEPTHFVECKWDDDDISPALRYMQKKFSGAAFWQISAVGRKDYVTTEGIRVAPAVRFLAELV